jgi:hypothetical protein
MEKLIYILLFYFIPLLSFGQGNFDIYKNKESGEIDILQPLVGGLYINDKGEIVFDDIEQYSGGDVSDTSLLLYYNSDNVTKEGLTYNSTGDTIVSVSSNIVVIDNYDKAVVGNSIRFGDPESGTIYTILSIDVDELTLDQICTENIGDEFYIGCDGYIEDQSIYDNDGAQAIGAYQPKGIWIETDSSRWFFDGVDDYLTVSTMNLETVNTISYWMKVIKFPVLLIGTNSPSFNYIYHGSSTTLQYKAGTGTGKDLIIPALNINEWYNIILIRNELNILLYINNILKDSDVLDENNQFLFNRIGGYLSYYVFGSFDDINFYNKALSEPERTELYESSKHYNP